MLCVIFVEVFTLKTLKIMTEDKMKEANELRGKIDDLKNHHRAIMNYNGEAVTPERRILRSGLRDSTADRILRDEFLPIAPPVIIEMYLLNVNKEIDRLEKEFESL